MIKAIKIKEEEVWYEFVRNIALIEYRMLVFKIDLVKIVMVVVPDSIQISADCLSNSIGMVTIATLL